MKFFFYLILFMPFFVSCNDKSVNSSFEGIWLSSSYIRNEYTVFENKGIIKVYHKKVSGVPYSEGEWKLERKYFYWRFNKLEGKSVPPTEWQKFSFEFLEDGKKLAMTHVTKGNFVVSQPNSVMERVESPPK